jgi:hypothetical protein
MVNISPKSCATKLGEDFEAEITLYHTPVPDNISSKTMMIDGKKS